MENVDIKLNTQIENKLLRRKELSFTAYYKGKTPIKEEIKEEICKMLNLKPETTIILSIEQQYGVQESTIRANSYDKKEDMLRFERTKKNNNTEKTTQDKKQAPTETNASAKTDTKDKKA